MSNSTRLEQLETLMQILHDHARVDDLRWALNDWLEYADPDPEYRDTVIYLFRRELL